MTLKGISISVEQTKYYVLTVMKRDINLTYILNKPKMVEFITVDKKMQPKRSDNLPFFTQQCTWDRCTTSVSMLIFVLRCIHASMRAKAYASAIAKNSTNATSFAHNKSNFIENLMVIKSLYSYYFKVLGCV